MKRSGVVNAASAFLGITLPLSAAIWFMSDSGQDFYERITPDSAAEAVVQRLPQVAVIGQKEGPAGTTEVFIQVPGVMNMQSVYVLSDGKTVISGFVLPDMEKGGVPGGQLEMPTGQPSVNPSEQREGLDDLLTLIRQNPEMRDQVLALAGANASGSGGNAPATNTAADELPSPEAPAANNVVNEPVVADSSELPAPSPAPKASPTSEPKPAATPSVPSPSVVDRAPNVPQVPAANGSGSGSESEAVPDRTSQASAAAAPSVPSPRTPEPTTNSPQAGNDESQAVDSNTGSLDKLTIVDLDGAPEFSAYLKKMLTGADPEIDSIRSLTDPQSQQAAYLNYVKERPAIIQGDGPRHLYVLFDPNCPVCHQYYDQVTPKVERGQLTVHWIPAVVFPDRRSSVTASAQLLSLVKGGYQDQALQMLENAMQSQGYTQTLDNHYSDDQHAHALEGVVRGSATMAMARPETPLIVYETEDGSLSMRTGLPLPGYEMEVKVQQEVGSAQ
jgi:hypothetical protein